MERIFFGHDLNLLQVFVSRVDIYTIIALLETYGRTRSVFFKYRSIMAQCMGASCVAELKCAIVNTVSEENNVLSKYIRDWIAMGKNRLKFALHMEYHFCTSLWKSDSTIDDMYWACRNDCVMLVQGYYNNSCTVRNRWTEPLEKPLETAIEHNSHSVVNFLLHPSNITHKRANRIIMIKTTLITETSMTYGISYLLNWIPPRMHHLSSFKSLLLLLKSNE